jgi:hypothetical protein
MLRAGEKEIAQGDYWNGHDIKTDAKLVRELFNGRVVRNQTRAILKFSDNPREGLEALGRLLAYGLKRWSPKDEFSEALTELMCALDPDSNTPRKLEIGFRKKGNRSDRAADFQIMLHVGNRQLEGEKKESAVASAMKTFGLSRKAIFESLARAENYLDKMGVSSGL